MSEADDFKYAKGVSPRVKRPLRTIEWLTVGHVAVFLIASTWAFGGQASWVRGPLATWGSLGVFITLAALLDLQAWRDGALRPVTWLWPMVAFNVVVLVANLNPSFAEIVSGTDVMLANQGGHAGWPSSARPALATHALWLFDVTWLSCFNIALIVRRRRAIRVLLIVAVLNALVLAVFGTIQKLGGATGIYFNAISTPQKYFFASFVYHNHWGAFALLMIAISIGLVWHLSRHRESRDIFHSPAFGAVIAILLIAATIPLSGSRSTTILAMGFGLGTFLHWTARLVRKRRHYHESLGLPLLGSIAAAILAIAGVWYVARDSIRVRFALTEHQIAEMQSQGNIGSRAILYRDTLHMAKDKPWFGWGMASYPHVFLLYNSQHSVDRLPVFYHDAHSDWLQSFAEHGMVGTLLLGLCALFPLMTLRRRDWVNPISGYLFAGCAIIALYAWIEFPFGNFAVVLVWWMCFFAAVQYARLRDRNRSRRAHSPSAHE